jgi:hypothetical protein
MQIAVSKKLVFQGVPSGVNSFHIKNCEKPAVHGKAYWE